MNIKTHDTIKKFVEFNIKTLSAIDKKMATNLGFPTVAKAKEAYNDLNVRFINDCIYQDKNKCDRLLINPDHYTMKTLNILAKDYMIDRFQRKPRRQKFIVFDNFGDWYKSGGYWNKTAEWAVAIYKVRKAKFGYYYERDIRYTCLTLNSKLEKHLRKVLEHDHDLKTITKKKEVEINDIKYSLVEHFMKIKGFKDPIYLGGYLCRDGVKYHFKHDGKNLKHNAKKLEYKISSLSKLEEAKNTGDTLYSVNKVKEKFGFCEFGISEFCEAMNIDTSSRLLASEIKQLMKNASDYLKNKYRSEFMAFRRYG